VSEAVLNLVEVPSLSTGQLQGYAASR